MNLFEIIALALVVAFICTAYSLGGFWLCIPATALLCLGLHRLTLRLRAVNDRAGR